MKKIIFILLLSIAALSCEKDKSATFSIFTNIVNVDANNTTYEIWVKNSVNWTVIIPEEAQSWLSYDKVIKENEVDTCLLLFKVNQNLESRKVEIIIKDLVSGRFYEVGVTQQPQSPSFYFSPSKIIVESGKVDATLSMSVNADSYTIDHKPSWVSSVDIIDTSDEYKKDVKVIMQPNNAIGFREDSIVYNVKWTVLNKTQKVALRVLQLGAGTLNTDKVNLEAIYNKMSGANWSSEYRWDLSQDLRTWKGVTVAYVGNGMGERVIGLQLSNVGLVGDIPAEVMNLPYLKVLWLDKNKSVTGTIPENIGDLVLMENLRLGETSIKGDMPISISKMTNLFSLAVNSTGNDGVSGVVPNNYSELTNIVTLDLSNNNLSGTLPEDVGNLKLLQNINISGNNFTGIIPKTYLNNYMWPYWNIGVNVCPQRGTGFVNCSL